MLVTRERRVVEEEVTQVITSTNSDDNRKKWMKREENRLESFKLRYYNQPQFDVSLAQRLARAGFYRPESDCTECFSCGLRKKVGFWLRGNDPETVHNELRPNCEFIKQLLRELMKYEQKRLYSFASSFLKDDQLDNASLARAGFYYSGHGTKCFSCGMWKPLSVWQSGYDPMTVHRKLRPDCKFLTGQREQQSPSSPHKTQKPKPDKKDVKQRENNKTRKNQAAPSSNRNKDITSLEEKQNVKEETKTGVRGADELTKLEKKTSETTSPPVVDTWQTAVDASQIAVGASQPVVETSQPVVDTSQPTGDTSQAMVYQHLSVTHHKWTENDVSWTVSEASRSVDPSESQSSDVEKGNPTRSPVTQGKRITQESLTVRMILFAQFFVLCWKESTIFFKKKQTKNFKN